jgi:hypothetical protein
MSSAADRPEHNIDDLLAELARIWYTDYGIWGSGRLAVVI